MTRAQPKISVIIPTRNREHQLFRGLEALSRQTGELQTLEVVVVSDGSTDGTESALSQYRPPYRLHWLRQEGLGPAAARNLGAAEASGATLAFLDDDIEVAPHWLTSHLEAHEGEEDRVVVGYLPPRAEGTSRYFRRELEEWWEAMFERMRRPGHRFSYSDLLSGNFSLQRSLFDRAGGFDPELRCHEDYDLGVRLVGLGAHIVFEPAASGVHHEKTDAARACARKVEEGRADVSMARRYPGIALTMPLGEQGPFGSRLARVLRSGSITAPGATRRAMPWGARLLDVLERARIFGLWRRLLDAMLHLSYWAGAAELLESTKELRELQRVDPPSSRLPEIDLADGLVRAERFLDETRPNGVSLSFRGTPVAEWRPRVGAEPLRGDHLRPALHGPFAIPLLRALVKHGRVAPISEVPELQELLERASHPDLSWRLTHLDNPPGP